MLAAAAAIGIYTGQPTASPSQAAEPGARSCVELGESSIVPCRSASTTGERAGSRASNEPRADSRPTSTPQAAEVALATPVTLFVRERPLDAVFQDLAAIAGLRMRINDRLDETVVSDTRLSGTAREVLDELTRRYNLAWFAERSLVDISRADTASVSTFRIDGVSDADIRDALERFGLVNADFALEVDERNGVARVFAPPRLASRLESIIVGLRPDEPVRAGPIEIYEFGLRTE